MERQYFDSRAQCKNPPQAVGHPCWLILFGVAGIWMYARKFELIPSQSRGLYILTGVVALQFLFGILTVVYVVPLALAVTHQLFAAILFAAAINVNHALRE